MSNQYIEEIKHGAQFDIVYDSFGRPNQVRVAGTTIPVGNDNFEATLTYIDANNLRPSLAFKWVQIVTGKEGNVLHYVCDQGSFVDDPDNAVTRDLKQCIANGTIEIRAETPPASVLSLEVNVFLSRKFTLNKLDAAASWRFDTKMLGLPFSAEMAVLQTIEDDFFANNNLVKSWLHDVSGNVIRIFITTKNIGPIFNWADQFMREDRHFLEESLETDFALFKRSKTRGPRTAWYFDWLNLQQYLWIPVLHIANRVIGRINLHIHRKTLGLLSRDDLGSVTYIKARLEDGSHRHWFLSSVQDSQLQLFAEDWNRDHSLVDIAFYRVRFLLDRSLYFEATVVAQALLESIVNGMFPEEDMVRWFGRANIKWREKYTYLRQFVEPRLHRHHDKVHLRTYLNGGLRRLYEFRNRYAHDVLVQRPSYDFDSNEFNEINILLRPFVDHFERSLFLQDVTAMYELRPQFLSWLQQQAPRR